MREILCQPCTDQLNPLDSKGNYSARWIIRSWYTGRWWVGCYIWYSEEGPGRAAALPSPILAGFVEKVGFEPGVKEWRSDRWREWGWWQRWVEKWMSRWIETRMVRLTEWIWKLIPKTRWCISKWAICVFKEMVCAPRARKSDNRWGAGTARRLERDKVVKIARLSSCKNFVSEREKSIFDAFVDL